MSEQKQIQLLKEYIAYLEARLLHSDMMYDQTMEMLRKLVGKIK